MPCVGGGAVLECNVLNGRPLARMSDFDAISPVARERIGLRTPRVNSDFEGVRLPEMPDVPGMISPGEGRYLYWLVSDTYAGVGAIVEIGTWLGRSTIHLASGLRDSGVRGKLHSFDNFLWAGGSDSQKSGLDLKRGENFRSFFEKNIAPYRAIIEVTEGNFEEYSWDSDAPIEILFLDAPKDAPSLSTCLGTFGPALVPGVSTVVSQDYQHPLSYDLPLAFHRLRSKLEMVHTVESGGSVGFQVIAPIAPEDVTAATLDWRGLSKQQVMVAWEEVHSSVNGKVLERLKSACALHLCELGSIDEAAAMLRSVEFDSRLHAGWNNWCQAGSLRKKYGAIFDVYQRELKA